MAIEPVRVILEGEDRVYRTIGQVVTRADRMAGQIRQNLTRAFEGIDRTVQANYEKALQGASRLSQKVANAPEIQALKQDLRALQGEVSQATAAVQQRLQQAGQGIHKVTQATLSGVRDLATKSRTGQVIIQGFNLARGQIEGRLIPPMQQALEKLKAVATQKAGEISAAIKRKLMPDSADTARGYAGMAEALGGDYRSAKQATRIGADAGLTGSRLQEAITQYQRLERLGVPLVQQQKMLTQSLGLTAQQFTAAGKAAKLFGAAGAGG